MARGMDFRKPRLGDIQPLRACVCASIRQRFRTVHATVYLSGKLGKDLNFITNDVFLLLKYDGNHNW